MFNRDLNVRSLFNKKRQYYSFYFIPRISRSTRNVDSATTRSSPRELYTPLFDAAPYIRVGISILRACLRVFSYFLLTIIPF